MPGLRVGQPCPYEEKGLPVLSAPIDIEDRHYDIVFRSTHGPLADGGETYLAATLLPAMKIKADLRLPAPVSARLLEHLPQIQDIFCAWHKDLQRIAVHATPRITTAPAPGRGVGCFFSAGVDSFYSVLKHQDEITHLIYIHGFDVRLDDEARRDELAPALRQAAAELGKPLIEVSTNLRWLLDPYTEWGGQSHGVALAAVAHLLSPLLRKVYIASSYDYEILFPWGSHPLLDPLWSSEGMEIVHDGCEATRLHKIARLAQSEVALRWLRVCYENRPGSYNCGQCGKCLRAMAALEIYGALERCRTFDRPLDLEALARMNLEGVDHRAGTVKLLEEVERLGTHPQIAQALRTALAQPTPVSQTESHAGPTAAAQPSPDEVWTFWARPDTRRRLEENTLAKVLLVGGFVGAWMAGDLVRLEAILRWHRQRASDGMCCPVVLTSRFHTKEDIERVEQVFAASDLLFVVATAAAATHARALGLEPVRGGIGGPLLLHVYGSAFERPWSRALITVLDSIFMEAVPHWYVISGQLVKREIAHLVGRHCRRFQPDLVGCRDVASADYLREHGVVVHLSADDVLDDGVAEGDAPPAARTLVDSSDIYSLEQHGTALADLLAAERAQVWHDAIGQTEERQRWLDLLKATLSAPPAQANLLARANSALAQMREDINRRVDIASLQARVEEREAVMAQLAELQAGLAVLQHAQAQLRILTSSTSWKITAPIRAVGAFLRRLRRR